MSRSSSLPCPRRNPERAPRMMCGHWLMFSMPPASTVSASPSWINCEPVITAWMPEPHRRFTVNAGISIGTPALSPTWRAP